jgi:hypothetical protein
MDEATLNGHLDKHLRVHTFPLGIKSIKPGEPLPEALGRKITGDVLKLFNIAPFFFTRGRVLMVKEVTVRADIKKFKNVPNFHV